MMEEKRSRRQFTREFKVEVVELLGDILSLDKQNQVEIHE